MIKLIAFITLLSTNAYTQFPTMVYGASELPDKKEDSVLLVQPDNAPNPLGNPIIAPEYNSNSNASFSKTTQNGPTISQNSKPSQIINQISEQNPADFSETMQEMKNKIENTLYQSGDRVYDIQSYPIKDINEITEPNIQPTITDYPEY